MTSRLPPDKKRFSLSLRTKKVDEFKALAKALGLPSTFLSAYVEYCIVALMPTFQAIKTMKNEGGDQITEAEILAAIFKGVADSEKDKILQLELFDK